MKTHPVIIIAAVFLLLLAVMCLFAPLNVLILVGSTGLYTPTVVVQLLGASFLGLGLLDWVSRNSTVGGIYGRPLVVANFSHFLCGAMVLFRSILYEQRLLIVIGLLIYAGFALFFGWLLFGKGVVKAPSGK